MFNKLSFAELAQLYTAVADLERHYGKEATHEGMKLMSERLDRKEPIKDVSRLDNNFNPVKVMQEQMELLSKVEPKKKETPRAVLSRSPHGQNDRIIREWCEEKFPGLSVEESLLSMYYRDRLTQTRIGKMIGVNQRAVGYYLERIPEKMKQNFLSDWGVKL